MKKLILLPVLFVTVAGFAQTQCATGARFRFDNTGSPKEIEKLGTAPEFPFLRNMSTTKQVVAAIHRNNANNGPGATEFNDLMTSIGFTNGAKDVTEANVTWHMMQYGTEGNMGSAGYTTAYSKLNGDPDGNKSWKITSGTGCYVYILAKCGNSFYPKPENKTACINVPVNITGDMKDVTLNSSGQKTTTTNNVFVYYHRKRHKKNAVEHPIAAISDPYPSDPVLLRTTAEVQSVPETYKVSVSSPVNTAYVCPDYTLNLTASINVEKTSEYAGYYPSKSKNEYKEVSKRAYRMAARKMRKIERKENKIARRTGVTVSQCSVASK